MVKRLVLESYLFVVKCGNFYFKIRAPSKPSQNISKKMSGISINRTEFLIGAKKM